MLKQVSTLLGVGLLILWIVGIGGSNASSWITWLDGIVALFAFAMAAFVPVYASKAVKMGLPLVISGILLSFWLIGMSTPTSQGLVWWNFIFALAFLGLGLSGGEERHPPMMETPKRFEKLKERKSA